jgi:RNA polymerase sigma-54 factor
MMLKLKHLTSKKVAEQIVGVWWWWLSRREISSIIDDLAFRQNVDTDEEEISDSLVVQQFDPPV